MQAWTFRVDASESFKREDVVKFFESHDDIDKYLIYYELSSKTQKYHYQGIMYTEVKENTMRQRIKRYFKCEGSSYSFAKVKKAEYEIYITKDGDKVCSKGYTNDDIDKLHSQSYKLPPPQSEPRKDFIDYMEEEFENYFDKNYAQKFGDEYDKFDDSMSLKEVMEWIIAFIVSKRKWTYMNVRQTTSLANYLVMKYTTKINFASRLRENFIKQCMDEFRY